MISLTLYVRNLIKMLKIDLTAEGMILEEHKNNFFFTECDAEQGLTLPFWRIF